MTNLRDNTDVIYPSEYCYFVCLLIFEQPFCFFSFFFHVCQTIAETNLATMCSMDFLQNLIIISSASLIRLEQAGTLDSRLQSTQTPQAIDKRALKKLMTYCMLCETHIVESGFCKQPVMYSSHQTARHFGARRGGRHH